MKRIVTIQDISCVGKCSLTVLCPLSLPWELRRPFLPTAVLSTHTMFPSPTCADLTDEIEPISGTGSPRIWTLTPSTPVIWPPAARSVWSAAFSRRSAGGNPCDRGSRHGGQWKALPRLLPGFSRTDEGALPAGGHPASQHHGGVFAYRSALQGKNTTEPIRRKC